MNAREEREIGRKGSAVVVCIHSRLHWKEIERERRGSGSFDLQHIVVALARSIGQLNSKMGEARRKEGGLTIERHCHIASENQEAVAC